MFLYGVRSDVNGQERSFRKSWLKGKQCLRTVGCLLFTELTVEVGHLQAIGSCGLIVGIRFPGIGVLAVVCQHASATGHVIIDKAHEIESADTDAYTCRASHTFIHPTGRRLDATSVFFVCIYAIRIQCPGNFPLLGPTGYQYIVYRIFSETVQMV